MTKDIPVEEVRRKVLVLIERYLGDYTAHLYADFYKNQDTETIVQSCEEILTELLGESSAKKQLDEIYKLTRRSA